MDAVGAVREIGFFLENPEVEMLKKEKENEDGLFGDGQVGRILERSFMRVRGGFIEMLDRSSAFNRAWGGMRPLITQKGKRNRE